MRVPSSAPPAENMGERARRVIASAVNVKWGVPPSTARLPQRKSSPFPHGIRIFSHVAQSEAM